MASRGAFSAERSAENVRSPGIDSDGLGVDSWFTNTGSQCCGGGGGRAAPTSRYSTCCTKAQMRKARPYPLTNTISHSVEIFTVEKNTTQTSLTAFVSMNQTVVMMHICIIVLNIVLKCVILHIYSQKMQRRASTFLMEWNTWVKYFNLNILKFCIFCTVEYSL